jgi:CubicO group peptidase (beta-lactamase class C family)
LTRCRTRQLLNALALLCLLPACVEEKIAPLVEGDASAATGRDGGAGAPGKVVANGKGGEGFKPFDDALAKAIAGYNASAAGADKPIVGASSIVVHKTRGLVHSQGYGEFDADRLYLIASSSKILSVGILMKLADDGLVDFDTPISEYLGASWGEHKTNVTLAQLFSNSSGLPSLPEIVALSSNPSVELYAQLAPHLCQYMSAGSLADCGKAIYEDENPANNRPPDEEFRYGGSQWQLAGAVAEVVTGKKWSELVQETYVEPCDVPSLGYTNQFGQEGVSPLDYPGFMADKDMLPVTENPSIEGGAYITGPDYAKLLLMHLRGGKCDDNQVLSSAAVKRMQVDRIAEYGGMPSTGMGPSPFTGYGLGWWMNDELVADPGAYGAFPFIDKERGYAAMVLIELSSTVGGQITLAAKPVLDGIMDTLKK